jgi:hypothetical protein
MLSSAASSGNADVLADLHEVLPHPGLQRQWIVNEPLNVKSGLAHIQAVVSICQKALELVYRERLISRPIASLGCSLGRVIEMHRNVLMHMPLEIRPIAAFHTLFPMANQHRMHLACN